MSDAVTRLNAALEGRYRIERELGEGGMATVYLADDLKHERKVALKVLKPELAAVVGAERFLAEIKTTANLQHPHILPLFDSGEADSFLFYVMPYVEGETLRERIDRDKQLPVDEALGIATAVANALQTAHDAGIIHRDIKPGNILLSRGEPLVADFGIALAVGAAGGNRLTETGLSVGTPYYMSPEQATGDQTIGPASDTYALACVLYEMLVGDPPYIGSTAQAVLGKIIQGVPVSASGVRKAVPPNVDAAIRKALEKLPADRFSGAQAFAKALGDPGFRYGDEAVSSGFGPRRQWQAVGLAMAAGVLLGVAGMSAFGGDEDAPSSSLLRFTIDAPESLAPTISPNFVDLAISADGRQIAYMGDMPSASMPQLNLRAFDQLEGAPLRGAEAGAHPFFSPDGEWVGFSHVLSGQMQKVSVLGGAPVTLTQPVSQLRGASWGTDDHIVFGSQSAGLFRVSGGGGEPEELTTLDPTRGETSHRWPSIIDGEDAVVFVIMQGGLGVMEGELATLDLATGEVVPLGIVGTTPRYVSTGHLVYADGDGSLRAVPFDAASRVVDGSPVPLVEGVMVKLSGAAQFSVSEGGRLVYERGSSGGEGGWQFVWVDREGDEDPLTLPPRPYNFPAISPDGRQIATSILRGSGQDLWVFDVATGAGLRLTHDDETNWIPTWAPDGQRIFFSSTRDAPRPDSFTGNEWYGNIYSVAADGSSEPQRVTTTEENQGVTGISPDGRTLVHSRVFTNADHWEIMALPAAGDEAAAPLVAGPYRRGSGTISPDGRWLAYRSDESGTFEVFVEPYPGPGAKVPASIGGGTHPGWSADSRELFYRGADGTMMSATIGGEETPEVVDRTPLFSHRPYRSGAGFRLHDEAPDGRFLMMRRPGTGSEDSDATALQITVVDNWFEELRERVPVG